MVTASAVRLSACVLTAPLVLAPECLALSGKHWNTVTKSHTEGSVLIKDCAFYTHMQVNNLIYIFAVFTTVKIFFIMVQQQAQTKYRKD